MNIFKDKPLFYYSGLALLVVYLALEILSSIVNQPTGETERFANLKYIGLMALNIYFVTSNNKTQNYLTIIVLGLLMASTYSQIYVSITRGYTAVVDIIPTLYGAKVIIMTLAMIIFSSKLLLDYYNKQPNSSESNG